MVGTVSNPKERREHYNKKISPFKFDKKTGKIIPANVNVYIAIRDILSIQEVDHVFSQKFRFFMEWYDYRLIYHNLKLSRSSNSLGVAEVEKLWIPFIVFENTENSEATRRSEDAEVTVIREGNFTKSPNEVMDEINIFQGADNKITFQQVYSKTLNCDFDLHYYPFDTQVIFF